MSTDSLSLVAFHLTGNRPGGAAPEVADLHLRPALLAAYSDLTKLRYDYPLVLVEGGADEAFARSLSDIINDVLVQLAPPGIEGEYQRKQLLKLEQEIRISVAQGARRSLSELWDQAQYELLSSLSGEEQKALKDCLSQARSIIRFNGDVIDCDEDMVGRLLTHAWLANQKNKTQDFQEQVGRLILKLKAILMADFQKSAEARTPDNLKGSMGSSFKSAFDFEALSHVLPTASPTEALPKSRRQRIRSALAILQSQHLFAAAFLGGMMDFLQNPHECEAGDESHHVFVFPSCTQALDALRERLPEMIELVKAIAIAELEVENRYKESKHDSFFDQFNESSLRPEDLALFPTYLVLLREQRCDAAEKAKIIEALSSNLPIKVLVQTDDILQPSSIATGRFSFGVRSLQLASMAVGLNNAYVLQSSGSNLYQLRDQIWNGLSYSGPALFSVFSGSAGPASDLPAYLIAAAAMDSRAFPAFTFDPFAGPNWASRFSIVDNPQANADWPMRNLSYEDEDLQRASLDLAFTFVDFVAGDKRYAEHFINVPRSEWQNGMIPAGEYLEQEVNGVGDKVPYVPMIDEHNVLQRLVVDDTMICAARRCREMWQSLQELGGIHNSHARKLLDSKREAWEQEKERELAELRAQPQSQTEKPVTEDALVVPEETAEMELEAVEEPASDDPYIETPRCTTCNECTDLNNKMFVYDENMQADIVDLDAGTYRQLVEAAESCQVAIIHPGKPKNQNEPNLEELIKRAEPFN